MILGWLAVVIVASACLATVTRWWQTASGPTADRIERFARRHPLRWRGVAWSVVAVRTARRAAAVRVTGLAAEMTYYALISLVPLAGAIGAALGFLDRIIGPAQADRLEAALVEAVAGVFADEIADDVMVPLIEGTLHQQRTGLAVGSIVIALWLASRMFRAAIRALDDAYQVTERRTLIQQVVLGVALAVSAVVTVLVLLSLIVVGPLFGGGREIAESLRIGGAFDTLWDLLRWPVVAAVCCGFLVLLYRWGPNTATTWRRCWPGALLGTLSLIVAAWGFQLYLATAGPRAPEVSDAGAAVDVATQMLGAILAAVLWVWVSSIVILMGGVVNAELERERDRG